ncbi:hypothetical protein WL92_25795 [Burkholderia multivorans]|uniref:hypothetical protein n=1 Tax=Burkholderia multivorans TaxID=87883 RepID=UPI000753258D|nr:hypothetical protein [Burkholderia multivorans]KWF68363.1 hypothetical protein WL91_16425 [Burkholderia multivorans]KWF74922.1 hypothetical protein WL92_25795 [Burkholderia multivorans]
MANSGLRKISPDQLADAIAGALEKLTGESLVVKIGKVAFKGSAIDELTGGRESVDVAFVASPKKGPFNIEMNLDE